MTLTQRAVCLAATVGLYLITAASAALAFTVPVEVSSTDGAIKAWLMEDHRLPIISVDAAFRGAGAAYDAPGKEGTALMSASMMLQGAGGKDHAAFHQAMDAIGMSLNIAAQNDHLIWSMQSLREHADEAFALATDALSSPIWANDAFTRLRTETIASLEMLQQDPEYVADRQFRSLAYEGHAYARAVQGSPESLARISLSDVQDFWQCHMTKQALVMAVVGDITPPQLQKQLDTLAARLPHCGDASALTALPDTQMQHRGERHHVEKNVPQTAVVFGLPGIKRQDKDFYPLYVLNQIMGGGGLTSRLARSIREEAGASYYVTMGLQPAEHVGILRGAFASKTDQVEHALKLLREELHKAQQKTITQEELTRTQDYITGSYAVHLDTYGDRSAYLLSMQLQELGIDFMQRRNALIRGVSLQQVNEVAQRYLRPEDLLVVSVGQTTPSSKDTSR